MGVKFVPPKVIDRTVLNDGWLALSTSGRLALGAYIGDQTHKDVERDDGELMTTERQAS